MVPMPTLYNLEGPRLPKLGSVEDLVGRRSIGTRGALGPQSTLLSASLTQNNYLSTLTHDAQYPVYQCLLFKAWKICGYQLGSVEDLVGRSIGTGLWGGMFPNDTVLCAS